MAIFNSIGLGQEYHTKKAYNDKGDRAVRIKVIDENTKSLYCEFKAPTNSSLEFKYGWVAAADLITLEELLRQSRVNGEDV